jgi:hypothetical protein
MIVIKIPLNVVVIEHRHSLAKKVTAEANFDGNPFTMDN